MTLPVYCQGSAALTTFATFCALGLTSADIRLTIEGAQR